MLKMFSHSQNRVFFLVGIFPGCSLFCSTHTHNCTKHEMLPKILDIFQETATRLAFILEFSARLVILMFLRKF